MEEVYKVYKVKEFVFESTKYACIWGLCEKLDGTLVGSEVWEFQKFYEGNHLSTSRQYIDIFDTYAELVAAFPDQEVPPEEEL
jgi:hypothetical protein